MKPAQMPAWWASRPLREKLMMIVGVTLALLASGDALITSPLEKKLRRSTGDASAMRAKLDTLRKQEAALRTRLQAAQKQQLALQQRVAEAARLPETLRAVVATVGATRLLELDLAGDSESAATAASPAATSGANPATPGGRRLYRLPITLKVSGSWSELQQLLGQIERHAQALQWQTLALDNQEWPAIQLTLKAHVLSLEPRWGASS